MGIISFHSLEDRIVKNFFRDKLKDCICPEQAPRCTCGRGHREIDLLTKKPIVPGEEEVTGNAPSRSARFRVAVKLKD